MTGEGRDIGEGVDIVIGDGGPATKTYSPLEHEEMLPRGVIGSG